MHPTVERLTSVLPPPELVPESVPWDGAVAALGHELPRDYRDFVDRYGGGQIDGELTVLSPTRRPPRPGWPSGLAGFAELAADVGRTFATLDDRPHPYFPAPGGLLVWGLTHESDHLFWLTEDPDPDRWPVVAWLRQAGPSPWHRFDGGAAEFLLAVLAGDPPLLPEVSAHTWTPSTW